MSRKAEKAEATRAALVRVAADLFAQRGYDATSIEDVLFGAGVSKGALYHHFSSKEALFEAVFEDSERWVAEQIAAGAAGEPDPMAMLRAGAQIWLDLVMDEKLRRISLIDGPAVLGWQRWREIDEKYGFGITKAVLQAAVDAGQVPAQPVELVAHMLLAGLGEAAMVIARAEDPARARREAGEAVDRLLAGFARG